MNLSMQLLDSVLVMKEKPQKVNGRNGELENTFTVRWRSVDADNRSC